MGVTGGDAMGESSTKTDKENARRIARQAS